MHMACFKIIQKNSKTINMDKFPQCTNKTHTYTNIFLQLTKSGHQLNKNILKYK